jgi:hypothetical protein
VSSLSGPTRSFSICEERDSRPTSGSVFKSFEQLLSEPWISVGELESEGRDDVLKVAPVVGSLANRKKLAPRSPSAKQVCGKRSERRSTFQSPQDR